MMELRLKVDTRFMKNLKKTMEIESDAELTATALTLLEWAGKQKKEGRNIITLSPEGKIHKKLFMPQLENIKTKYEGEG